MPGRREGGVKSQAAPTGKPASPGAEGTNVGILKCIRTASFALTFIAQPPLMTMPSTRTCVSARRMICAVRSVLRRALERGSANAARCVAARLIDRQMLIGVHAA
jgi:hypothetical protein